MGIVRMPNYATSYQRKKKKKKKKKPTLSYQAKVFYMELSMLACPWYPSDTREKWKVYEMSK